MGKLGVKKINGLAERSGRWAAHGIGLLFPVGEQPDLAALREWSARAGSFSISHAPTERRTDGSEAFDWAELLLDGLTFDVEGLAPGERLALPEAVHRFDIAESEVSAPCAVVRLIPGPHLSGGERSMPVVRTMLRLTCELARQAPGLRGIAWSPAKSASGPEYFTRVVGAWLDGGPFPALGLTAFKPGIDGALQSEGLAFFTGQELRIEPELAFDKAEATRLAIRLINQLVPLGRLDGPEVVTAPDGRTLHLVPSANGRYVRVREG